MYLYGIEETAKMIVVSPYFTRRRKQVHYSHDGYVLEASHSTKGSIRFTTYAIIEENGFVCS